MTKKRISRVTTSKEGIKKSYGKMSRWYSVAEWFERGVRQRGLELLNVQKGETVLEIGIGTGFTLVELAKSVGETGKVYGIDITPEMVGLAKERLKRKKLEEGVVLYEGDARKMPYRNNMFDAVYIAGTLELFGKTDIQKVLREIRRILKSAGRLGVVSVPKEGHEDSKILKIYEWFCKVFPSYASTPFYVEDTIRDAGYNVIKTDEVKIARLFPMKIVIAKP